jgi:hypothetical protein
MQTIPAQRRGEARLALYASSKTVIKQTTHSKIYGRKNMKTQKKPLKPLTVNKLRKTAV